jgi:hypothetical protein
MDQRSSIQAQRFFRRKDRSMKAFLTNRWTDRAGDRSSSSASSSSTLFRPLLSSFHDDEPRARRGCSFFLFAQLCGFVPLLLVPKYQQVSRRVTAAAVICRNRTDSISTSFTILIANITLILVSYSISQDTGYSGFFSLAFSLKSRLISSYDPNYDEINAIEIRNKHANVSYAIQYFSVMRYKFTILSFSSRNRDRDVIRCRSHANYRYCELRSR